MQFQVPPVRAAIDASYDGPIRITVVLGQWNKDTDGATLIALVENFILLGERGVFVRPSVHPVDAKMRVIATNHAEPVQYRWDVDAQRIDAKFVQVFRNLMVMFAAVYCPVQHVSIEMLAPSHPRMPSPIPPLDGLAVEQGLVYPGLSTKLTFGISFEGAADYRSDRRAEVELNGAVDDDKLLILRAWFDLWGKTLDFGYASNEKMLLEGKSPIWDAGTDLLDNVTLETHVDYWGSPECAWDGYLNLVGRIDREIAGVVAVRIY